MSEYWQSLVGSFDKGKYIAKLGTVGLSLKDDPYAKERQGNFEMNMTVWLPLEYGHTFSYFIRHPGVYTLEQLLSWKQLEGYNCFQSSYVTTIYSRGIGNGTRLCIMKAYVNPSQRTPDKAHQAWVVVKDDGHIVTAHCKMVACDNPDCTREWFHFDCVGLARKPRGKWYCSNQ